MFNFSNNLESLEEEVYEDFAQALTASMLTFRIESSPGFTITYLTPNAADDGCMVYRVDFTTGDSLFIRGTVDDKGANWVIKGAL